MSNKILCKKCGGVKNPDGFTAPEFHCSCDADKRGGYDCDHQGMTGLDTCLICHEPLKKKKG